MKRLTRFLTWLLFSTSISLVVQVQAALGGRPQQDAQRDTLKSNLGQKVVPRSGNTFRPLPRFHPKKDTAGFQLIPTQSDAVGDPVIVPDISITVPNDEVPQVLKKVEPTYPDSAKREGLEGKVVLEIRIDEKGKVTQVDVSNSDAEIFIKPAMEAAKQFVFTPAYVNHKPVAARVSYTLLFRLPDRR